MITKITFSPDCAGHPITTALNRATLNTKLDQVLADCEVQGASLAKGVGYWEGSREQSYTLTLAEVSPELADRIAAELKTRFKQQAVMIEQVENTARFI